MVTPRVSASQSVGNVQLAISPGPSERWPSADFYGNPSLTFFVDRPHKELGVTISATVEVRRNPPPLAAGAISWEQVVAEARQARSLSANAPAHFLAPSALTEVDPAILAYVGSSMRPGVSILDAIIDLNKRLQADIAYDPEATSVTTRAPEAFAGKAGVCQDFSHIMIAGLRAYGIPAAYVSGYLRTIPPPGQPRLEGADAMHAWVDVWCGSAAGWVGVDPTNGITVENDHIVVGYGRDYADVAPVRGVVMLAGEQSHKVAVDVEPLGA